MTVSRKIDDLHPRVAQMCRQFVAKAKAAGIDTIITSTYRCLEAQADLYAQGRTKPGRIVTQARPGYSWHNFRLAFDFVPVVAGRARWNDLPAFRECGRIGKDLGLEWGGDWPKFKDYPHFQWTGGLTLKQMRAGARP